jgi:site-specific DNA-cytosine methylase
MEMLVDSFAGGGGASTGIRMAMGREVDIAINHDPEAMSKAAQVRMCGNSVSPPTARALVEANMVRNAQRIAA